MVPADEDVGLNELVGPGGGGTGAAFVQQQALRLSMWGRADQARNRVALRGVPHGGI